MSARPVRLLDLGGVTDTAPCPGAPAAAAPDRDRATGWAFTSDAALFLRRATGLFAATRVVHTVPMTIAHGLRTRPETYGSDAPLLGTYRDDTGEVRGVAVWTPPFPPYAGPLDPAAAEALAGLLADGGPDGTWPPFTQFTSERGTAAVLAGALTRRTGRACALAQRQRLHRLDTLTPPEPAPPGSPRPAGPDDRALLTEWFEGFVADSGVPPQAAGPWIARVLERRGATLWEDEAGTPVAMAAFTPEVAGATRVTTVYTPPAHRRRGYAGAVTAEVSRTARAAGAEEVLLFTDLANPTSNALYQRIGYRRVADFAMYAAS